MQPGPFPVSRMPSFHTRKRLEFDDDYVRRKEWEGFFVLHTLSLSHLQDVIETACLKRFRTLVGSRHKILSAAPFSCCDLVLETEEEGNQN